MTEVAIMTKSDMDKLMAELHNTNTMLKLLLQKTTLPKTISVADIAQMEGVSVTSLTERKPWLLPNFGKSDFSDKKRRWKFETYAAWSEIPEAQRKQMFQTHMLNNK